MTDRREIIIACAVCCASVVVSMCAAVMIFVLRDHPIAVAFSTMCAVAGILIPSVWVIRISGADRKREVNEIEEDW